MDVEDVLNINDEALKTASVVQCIAMVVQLSTDYQVASNSMECPMRGDPTELQAIKDRQKELYQRFIESQKKITTTKRKRKREEQQAAVAAQPTAAGIGEGAQEDSPNAHIATPATQPAKPPAGADVEWLMTQEQDPALCAKARKTACFLKKPKGLSSAATKKSKRRTLRPEEHVSTT